jgi:hypothetical protein
MNISRMAQRTKQVISNNAPAILSGVAIAGTVVTGVLAGRAGYKAGYSVALDEATGGVPEADATVADRRKRLAKQTWKLYITPAVAGVGTVAAIATGTKISTNRTAALAAAYTIVDKSFGEYKETEVRDKIMQDRVAEDQRSTLVVIGNNDVLCYDAFSDRYFQSNMEALKKAQNDTNYEIMHNLYVSLSEFYERIGLPKTSFSDEIGWNKDYLVELEFSSVMTPDQRPALGFTFRVNPRTKFYKAKDD